MARLFSQISERNQNSVLLTFVMLLAFFPSVLLGLSFFSGEAMARTLYHLQPGDLPEANPFAPSVIFMEGEEKDEQGRIRRTLPKVMKDGVVIYEDLSQKDPAKMTEEEFYKTLSGAEKNILATKPETGPALFKAAVEIAAVGRPHFALLLLQKSLELSGEPSEYAAVLEFLGTERSYQLISNPIIRTIGVQALEKATGEAKKHWEDPDVIQAAMDNAFHGTSEQKTAALQVIHRGGPITLLMLLDQLENGSEDEVEKAKLFFTSLGDYTTGALLVALKAKDELLVQRVIEVLGSTKDASIPGILSALYYSDTTSPSLQAVLSAAIDRQVGHLPSAETVFDDFYRQSLEWYHQEKTVPHLIDGVTTVWRWNDRNQQPFLETVSEEAYCRNKAVEMAEWADLVGRTLNIPAKTDAFLALYMTAKAEQIVYEAGLDAPVDTTSFTETFPDVTTQQLENSLQWAMTSQHDKGGIIPVVLLGKTGDRSLCYGNKEPSLLVKAVSSPDRRLRFAALSAIYRLDPDKPYPGARCVVSELVRFASSTGKKKIVVATIRLEDAMFVGSHFTAGGYSIISAVTGNDVIKWVQGDPDIEAVFASEQIRSPDLRTTIQMMNSDYRTADVPIAVDSRNTIETLRFVAGKSPKSNFAELTFPYDSDSGKSLLDQLQAKTNREQVPAGVRLAQAKAVAGFYAILFQKHPHLYGMEDLESFVRRLIDRSEMTDIGLQFVGEIATSSIQNHLANLIGDVRLTDELRRKCLIAFSAHLKKYGSLLRGPDIVRLYDRYNATEQEDKQSQDMLAAMLDSYESVAKGK